MAQMKEQKKTPEKELSQMEIANLSDAEFKTPVIRMPRELTEYSKCIMEEMKATLSKIKKNPALAGMALWIECWPVSQRVAGSIPCLGHMPGLWARSPVGGLRGNHTLMFLSLSFFHPSPLSTNK